MHHLSCVVQAAEYVQADLMDGAILFADVSGFTVMSERLKSEYEEEQGSAIAPVEYT